MMLVELVLFFHLLLIRTAAGFVVILPAQKQQFSRGSNSRPWQNECRVSALPDLAQADKEDEHDNEDDNGTAILMNPSRVVAKQQPSKTQSLSSRDLSNTEYSNWNQQNRQKTTNGSKSNRRPSSSSSSSIPDNSSRKLNEELVKAESATAVLQLLQQNAKLQQVAAGKTLNSVNFSTALHRLARHAVGTNYKQDRALILADPRTALLLASIAEALSANPQFFKSRELSNIGWALAKLKLPPPAEAMPLLDYFGTTTTATTTTTTTTTTNTSPSTTTTTADSLMQKSIGMLAATAATVRNTVVQVAAERVRRNAAGGILGASSSSSSANHHQWIPALSQLAGHILDAIGATVVIAEQQQQSASQSKKWFQMQEWANLLWAWATAGRADSAVFGLVVRNMIEQQSRKLKEDTGSLRPQEWSNSVWAFATAQCYDNHADLLEYVAELLANHPDFIDTFKSQELSNTAWGVATLLSNKKQQQGESESGVTVTEREQKAALTILRHVSASLVRRQAQGFRTQELSNTAWAAATLGFGLTQGQEASLNNYVVLHSDQPAADAQRMVDMIDTIGGAALQQMSHFSSQELNNLAWALARLLGDDNHNLAKASTEAFRVKMRALLQGIGMQLSDRRRQVKAQDVGTTLWSLATSEFFDDKIYRGIAARLTPDQAHQYKPQELSNTIWAFATAAIEIDDVDVFDTSLVPAALRPASPRDPVTICFGVAAQELMRRPHQFKPQEIKDVLWSFSKVGIRHPALFKAVAEHLVGSEDGVVNARGLDEFSPQGLGNMAWAFARQAQLSEGVSNRLNLNAGNGRLIVYKTMFFDVGEQLLHNLFGAIVETNLRVHDKLRKAKPQDIANTAWAFATLGLKETRYMEAAKDILVDRSNRYVRGEKNAMTSFKGQELANLLWALATLNISPGNVLEALMPYLRESCEDETGKLTAASIARQFKRQELAIMAWASSVFGNYPEELMAFLYTGLLGLPGKERNPSYMQTIHKDFGLQMQAIMTLIYAQAEMDLRGCCQNLSLPDNFPDGWKRSNMELAFQDDHVTELSLELNLSTSKVQRAVSAAFSRIGFDHVEEHTITMEEMAQDHGVRVPLKQMEILSIDIANVEHKIAVEVDGPAHFISRIDDFGIGSVKSTVGGFSKIVNGKLEYQFGWTGEQQEMNGPTVLKERLLNSFGWRVVHLPFWEWYELGGDASAEEKYCRELLQTSAQVRGQVQGSLVLGPPKKSR